MNIPSLFDWLDRFTFLRGYPATYIILVTAVLIIIAWDWRIAVFALTVQYFAAGLLFADLLVPRLAMVKLLSGWFICLIFYVTARQVNWGRLPEDVLPGEVQQLQQERRVRIGPYLLPTTTPFRFFLSCMAALVVWNVGQRPEFQLPALSNELGYLNLAVYSLALMGLLTLGLTLEPLKVGMGILMVLMGFELFYSALEQSVAMLATLVGTNLAVALAISYLIQARYAIPSLIQDQG